MSPICKSSVNFHETRTAGEAPFRHGRSKKPVPAKKATGAFNPVVHMAENPGNSRRFPSWNRELQLNHNLQTAVVFDHCRPAPESVKLNRDSLQNFRASSSQNSEETRSSVFRKPFSKLRRGAPESEQPEPPEPPASLQRGQRAWQRQERSKPPQPGHSRSPQPAHSRSPQPERSKYAERSTLAAHSRSSAHSSNARAADSNGPGVHPRQPTTPQLRPTQPPS